MKDLYGVITLLKRFGIYIYTGNRHNDIMLMQSEVKDIYDNGLLLQQDYLLARMILQHELTLESEKNDN